MDDETYRKYVEEELRVAVKNPLPQSEWGFQTCSSRVDALNQFSTKRSAVDIRKSVGADGFAVRERAVSLVNSKIISRIFFMKPFHFPVARHFRDN